MEIYVSERGPSDITIRPMVYARDIYVNFALSLTHVGYLSTFFIVGSLAIEQLSVYFSARGAIPRLKSTYTKAKHKHTQTNVNRAHISSDPTARECVILLSIENYLRLSRRA